MQWRDISSYLRDDKERIPKSWDLTVGGLRIVVTRHIDYPPDVWLLSCEPLFSKIEMEEKDIESAKKAAVELVKDKLRRALRSLNTMPG